MQHRVFSKLSDIVSSARKIEKEIRKKTDTLRESEDEYRRLTEVEIPLLMDELEIDRFKMQDGTVIRLKRDIAVTISKKNPAKRNSAFKWLSLNGGEKICRHEFNIIFSTCKDDLDRAGKFKELLERYSFNNYSCKRNVHPGTLKKFIKDKINAGEDVQLELFEGYPVTKAVLTK